jgi:hypothetical protein
MVPKSKVERIHPLLYPKPEHHLHPKIGMFSRLMVSSPGKMSDIPIDSLLQTNNTIHTGRDRRRGMRENKKETKKAPFSTAGSVERCGKTG